MVRKKSSSSGSGDPREDARAQLQETYDQVAAANAAAMERMDNSKPTPSQAEVDMMRVGALDLEAPKENDGEPEDDQESFRKTMEARLHGPGYYTKGKSGTEPAA